MTLAARRWGGFPAVGNVRAAPRACVALDLRNQEPTGQKSDENCLATID